MPAGELVGDPVSRADDQRDAIALIRASIEGDQEATSILLDHCDLRAVAAELAYRADVLASIAFRRPERAHAFIAQLQADWAADEANS